MTARQLLLALWPFGCAAIVIAVAGMLLYRPSALVAWNMYVAFGVVFPIAALLLSRKSVPLRALYAIAGAGAIFIAYYLYQTKPVATLPFAAVEVLLVVALLRRSFRSRTAAAVTAAVMALIAAAAWGLASGVAWQVPIGDILAGRVPTMGGAPVALVLVIATIVVSLAVFMVEPPARPWALRLVDIAAVVLFGIVAARRDMGFAFDDYHVSFFVGPVEVVRQGGWLLWDAPSQYGVANIFLMAHVPVSTAYAAVMDTNALLMFIAAVITYAVARVWTRTWWSAASWSAVVLAVDFFAPDWINGVGPEHYPSVGPMRFIWCYAIVGLLVGAYLRTNDARTRRRALIIGTAIWVAAVAWSPESAFYASCAWFPAAAALAWRGTMPVTDRAWIGGALRTLQWWGIAAGALLLLMGCLQLVYMLHLGQGPDWGAYAEFGLLYGSGVGAVPLEPLGSVWILIADFAALIAIAVGVVRQTNRAALPLMLGLCGVQWATASYFVVRSHPNNVTNLLSLQILFLAAGLLVALRERLDASMVLALRLYLVPTVALVSALCISTPNGLPRQLKMSEYLNGGPGDWSAISPTLAAPVVTLLSRHHLHSRSPVLYDIGPARPLLPLKWPGADEGQPRVWTPALPIPMLGLLPTDRQSVYVQRFMAAHPMTGYLVTNTKPPEIAPQLGPGIRDALARWYTVTDIDREGPYVLTRYVPRPAR